MFKSVDLPYVIQFLTMFHNDHSTYVIFDSLLVTLTISCIIIFKPRPKLLEFHVLRILKMWLEAKVYRWKKNFPHPIAVSAYRSHFILERKNSITSGGLINVYRNWSTTLYNLHTNTYF